MLAQLGFADEARGDREQALANFRRAAQLNPNPAIIDRVRELERGVFAVPGTDTVLPQ